MIKHTASARSPLTARPSRSDQAFWQKVLKLIRQIFVSLVVIFVLGFVSFMVLLIAFLRNQPTEIVLFNSIDESQSINKSLLAFYNSQTGQLSLYRLDFSLFLPEAALLAESGFESLSEQELASKKLSSYQLEVVLSSVLDLNDFEFGQRSDLKRSLRRELTVRPVWSRDFWLTFSWWWRLERLPSSQITWRDFSSLEQWLNFNLAGEVRVSSEACSIAVVNQTTTDGLAASLGQALVRSGLFVARLTSERVEEVGNTRLITDASGECLEATEWLKSLLPVRDIETKVSREEANRYRANLVLLVGEDWAKLVSLLEEEDQPED